MFDKLFSCLNISKTKLTKYFEEKKNSARISTNTIERSNERNKNTKNTVSESKREFFITIIANEKLKMK